MTAPQDLDRWEPSPTMRQLRDAVAEAFGVGVLDLIGRSRRAHLVEARNAACWVIRAKYGISYPHLGRLMGGRDHSTVIHGRDNAIRQRERDAAYRATTDALLQWVPDATPARVNPVLVDRFMRPSPPPGPAVSRHEAVQRGRQVPARNRFEAEDETMADTDATRRFTGTQGLVAAIAASGGRFR